MTLKTKAVSVLILPDGRDAVILCFFYFQCKDEEEEEFFFFFFCTCLMVLLCSTDVSDLFKPVPGQHGQQPVEQIVDDISPV